VPNGGLPLVDTTDDRTDETEGPPGMLRPVNPQVPGSSPGRGAKSLVGASDEVPTNPPEVTPIVVPSFVPASIKKKG
jgi:hypothetical protein